ncbi:MAG: glycerol-3-phosphate dehydrogenase [Proteobacteria bacterium]|nr:MAG: glycerol-3-phosphate dehydrogenase [Pseudomonadota bacterium]
MTKIAVLGAGSWGTALSVVLVRAHRPHEVTLWARSAELAESLRRHRENNLYLPGISLPAKITITPDLAAAVASASIVIGAIPSANARNIYSQVADQLSADAMLVSATKGLEPSTHLRVSKIITQIWTERYGVHFSQRIGVLSGPSFAAEVARGEPTAVVLASPDARMAQVLQEEFAGPNFRVYTNDDVLGVELAGAMKNVIAIAAGACQGLGTGSNALAALITRGLREMTRLAVALGAKSETLYGLAGLGDLVLTCTGALSRNRHVGFELGRGRSLPDILASMRMVAEGVGTTAALLALAGEWGIELPITEQVNAILYHGKSPAEAIREIMERPLRRE